MKSKTLPAEGTLYSKRWSALFVLCTAQFIVIMDTSIIGVALPAIKSSLNYSQSGLQWIFNAYVIFFGGLLLLGGRLSDLYGPKKIFIAGFAILSAASLLAGLAWSDEVLNIGRALQGLGSALIAPAALTLVMGMFTDPKELGKALGFWGAAAAAGGSAGVFLGGVITEWLSWHWVFLVNIPLGILVMAVSTSLLLPGTTQKGKLNLASTILVTTALISVVYAIVTAESAGWASIQTLGLLVLSIVLFILFVVIQKKSKSPLVPLSIFNAKNLSAANIVMALMAAAWIPLWFFLNLYLQQILHLSAFQSGLALLPMTVLIMVLMVGFASKFIGMFGFKANLIAGLIALSASLFWFAAVPEHGTYLKDVLGASLLAAVGMSLAYIPGTIAAMSGAKPEETGLASGIVNTSYQIGSAIGLALVVAIAAAVQADLITSGASNLAALNTSFKIAFRTAGMIAALSALIAALGLKK